jgi:hypothetical protein
VASRSEAFAGIGKKTGHAGETVRRYMSHGRVTARFLAVFALAYEIDPEWVLLGKGALARLRRGGRGARLLGRIVNDPEHWYSQVADRLAIAIGDDNRFAVARRIRSDPENVRRHLLTGRISARVFVVFCRAYRIDPKWLLFGEGAPTRKRGQRIY